MRRKIERKIKENNGIILTDIIISIVVIIIFTGLISTLMYNSYVQAISIQKGANADAYATIILEKTDEKSFDEVNNDFLDTIKNEIQVDSEYSMTIDVTEENINVKKVTVNVKYTVNNKPQNIQISKLKIKE